MFRVPYFSQPKKGPEKCYLERSGPSWRILSPPLFVCVDTQNKIKRQCSSFSSWVFIFLWCLHFHSRQKDGKLSLNHCFWDICIPSSKLPTRLLPGHWEGPWAGLCVLLRSLFASAKMSVVSASMLLESAKRYEPVWLRRIPFGLVRVGVLLLAQPHLNSAMSTDPLSLGHRSSSSWLTHPTPQSPLWVTLQHLMAGMLAVICISLVNMQEHLKHSFCVNLKPRRTSDPISWPCSLYHPAISTLLWLPGWALGWPRTRVTGFRNTNTRHSVKWEFQINDPCFFSIIKCVVFGT